MTSVNGHNVPFSSVAEFVHYLQATLIFEPSRMRYQKENLGHPLVNQCVLRLGSKADFLLVLQK